MASAVIHLVIANELNKKLKLNNDQLLIGSIAPDISKQIGENKLKSHFLDNKENDIPNMERFLAKYQTSLTDPFVMGYFIHLYTDYLWFKYFITEIYDNKSIITVNGDSIKCSDKEFKYYIYNDYTNLNKDLLEMYKIDTSIFFKDNFNIKNIINEIPMNKLKIIINKTYEIIKESNKKKEYIFNLDNINRFIETTINLIEAKLKELKYL